jgi:hypothetical protein
VVPLHPMRLLRVPHSFDRPCSRDWRLVLPVGLRARAGGILAKYARRICQTDVAHASWLKVKTSSYSHAEGRAELFEQGRSPERR